VSEKEGKWENGMIKRFPGIGNSIFVCYNCGGDWENFKNYTAALTNVEDLYLGWKQQTKNVEL